MLHSSVGAPRNIGRYLVERRLGQGGMADLFLCRQVGMGGFDRLVVVKQIRSDLRLRDDIIYMFLDEARMAAQISHPNVVQIFEIDEVGGLPYIVMEYVRGVSFETLVQAMLNRHELLPSDLVAALGAQVCFGLHAAHELQDSAGQILGLVHRDITPQNLLVSTDGVVKIIDFGIARAKGRLAQTHAGRSVIKGRLAYLAPELLNGGVVDRRADLYALGVVLHEMLLGRLLFERGTEMATINAVLTGAIPSLHQSRPDIEPGLSSVLDQILQADPAARLGTAAELGFALHEVAMYTGRYVTPPLVGQYLSGLRLPELMTLPQRTLPTTSRLPILERLQRPSDERLLGDGAQLPEDQPVPRSERPSLMIPMRPTLRTSRADQPTEVTTAIREMTEVVRPRRLLGTGSLAVLCAIAVALLGLWLLWR